MKKVKIDRQEIYDKCGGHCAYCGIELIITDMQVEHIIPKANFEMYVCNKFKVPPFLKHLKSGHENHIDNLFPSCRLCNGYKHTLALEDFRYQLSLQIERARESVNYRLCCRYEQIQEVQKPIVFYFEKKA